MICFVILMQLSSLIFFFWRGLECRGRILPQRPRVAGHFPITRVDSSEYTSSSALSISLRNGDILHDPMSNQRKKLEVFSYYWDLFLAWPLLISSLVAGSLLFSQQPDDRVKGVKCVAI